MEPTRIELKGNTFTFKYPRPEVNSFQTFVFVPVIDGKALPLSGTPGKYIVTFGFSIPGVGLPAADTNFDYGVDHGKSLITFMTPTNKKLHASMAPNSDVELLVNESGMLHGARITLTAKTFVDAYERSADIINPWLSYVSFMGNCAIENHSARIVEVSTGTFGISTLHIGRGVTINGLQILPITQEVAALLSAYREGLNSLDVFWKFMCFWKISEGVHLLREKRAVLAKQLGQPVETFPSEHIPGAAESFDMNDVDNEFIRPYFGKRFGKIKQSLESTHRDAVAHLNPDRSPLIIDSATSVTKINNAIPVIRYIAHKMIRNELDRASS